MQIYKTEHVNFAYLTNLKMKIILSVDAQNILFIETFVEYSNQRKCKFYKYIW